MLTISFRDRRRIIQGPQALFFARVAFLSDNVHDPGHSMHRPAWFIGNQPSCIEGYFKRSIFVASMGILQPVRFHPILNWSWLTDGVHAYRSKFSIYTTTPENWTQILVLAQRWSFKEVEQLCVRELEKLSIPPVEKIRIYQGFKLDRSLLLKSFAKLTVRPDPLNLEEAQKIGLETTLQIAQARELSRGANAGTKPAVIQLHDSELRSAIRDVFGLDEELDAFDFMVPNSFNL